MDELDDEVGVGGGLSEPEPLSKRQTKRLKRLESTVSVAFAISAGKMRARLEMHATGLRSLYGPQRRVQAQACLADRYRATHQPSI